MSAKFYGYVPGVRSYTIKFLFLHHISSTIGTEYEAKLTVPALTMCLLDMIMHVMNTSANSDGPNQLTAINVVTKDTFQLRIVTDPDTRFSGDHIFHAMTPALSILSCKFLQQIINDDITADNLPLVNEPNPFLRSAYEMYQSIFGPQRMYTHGRIDYVTAMKHYIQGLDVIFKDQQSEVHALSLSGFCRGASADRILACRVQGQPVASSLEPILKKLDYVAQAYVIPRVPTKCRDA